MSTAKVTGHALITFKFLVPLYEDSANSVPSIKAELDDDATRWDVAGQLVENEQFKTRVELFAGSNEQAAAWIKEAMDEHGERDDDLGDAEDDDLEDGDIEDDEEA